VTLGAIAYGAVLGGRVAAVITETPPGPASRPAMPRRHGDEFAVAASSTSP
jgi:hypothetical protein